MANNIKRMIKEDGVVLETIFKEATDTFTASDGKIVPAQPDRYVLRCVSGQSFDKNTGFQASNILDYKVDKSIYDKVVAYSPVTVQYEFSNYGVKPDSVLLKNN